MSLYLYIIILIPLVPFVLSFEKNLRFYKKWKFLFAGIFITMVPFLVWDYLFTINGLWGFNEKYILGFNLFHLPIEEILFFVVVPYASLFAFYAIRFHFPKYELGTNTTNILVIFMLFFSITMGAVNPSKLYTFVNSLFFAAILLTAYLAQPKLLGAYLAVFPVILIPFLVVNGILTGTGIEGEIVWYNPDAITGFRVLTIPVEDFLYAFSLILGVLTLTEIFQKPTPGKNG